jgi:hypothetical protein
MSHIETGTTRLKLLALAELIRQGKEEQLAQHPCLKLLRHAVMLVADELGGTIQLTYFTYRFRPQIPNTRLALHIEGRLPRGIGLEVNLQTGALTFKGDSWEVDPAFYEQVQQKIVQQYVVLAHCAALRRMNAQVSTQIVDEQVVITGVLHG